MRFHEVRTKSALNRVPAASRVPFNWTVNPYRGCSHACVYCLAGDTLILLADGGVRPLADLRVGDHIYGTRKGRYVTTEVLAHWRTRKPGYRVTLEDGTKILASGDHRFLSRHGWGYVASEDGVSAGRPATERLGRVGQSLGRHLAPAPAVARRRGRLGRGRRPAGAGDRGAARRRRSVRRGPGRGRRLPPRLPVRGRPWGRPPLPPDARGPGGAGARRPVPGCARAVDDRSGRRGLSRGASGATHGGVAAPRAHVAVGCR